MSNEENYGLFADRVGRVVEDHKVRRHQSMARLTYRDRAPGAGLPYGKILLVVAICIVLKALAIASLSEGSYRTHIMYLETGSTAERLIGAALAPDRISLALSRHLSW